MGSILTPFTLSPSPRRLRSWLLLLSVFFFSLPHLSFAFAQVGGLPRIKQPPLVRIIGAFVPLEDTQRSTLQTLTVRVRENKWRMRIREIKALTATTHSGWSLLNDLFPPHLRLTGPDELIASLQREDIAGHPLILEGRLYVGDHMLFLTAVTVNDP
jgi:hypothetical protein